MEKTKVEVFYPTCQSDWRKWLEINHISKQSVWLVFYNKASQKPTISWSESVDQALCFGWIDSKKVKIDDEKSHQFFSKRKAKSTWSKINKEKVELLIEAGLMTQSGLNSIEIAKENGSWTILDSVEACSIPDDFRIALESKPNALPNFLAFSKSTKKICLSWLVFAKRSETRQKRINALVELAEKNQKPKQL